MNAHSMTNALRRFAGTIALTGLAFLAGCSAMQAQNPSGALQPVNAVPVANGERLMLKGADVTAYLTQAKYVQGDPQFKSVYEGVTFYFASADTKGMFDKEPKKYIPEYGGYCANGIVYGIPWGGDADSFMVIGGKVYIFGGQGSRDGFLIDVPRNMALAEKYWKEEVNGSNSFWQRSKRLVFRVPHYKSGSELAKEVAEKKAKG